MSKNPHWARDELILALDLYLTGNRRQLDDTDPDVIALSRLLNDLPVHPPESRAEGFRTPMSVSMKLANFLAIDPENTRVGLRRGSRSDQEIWDEFADDPQRLHAVAQAIRHFSATEEAKPATTAEDDPGETFPEGRLLTRIHLRRERNRRLVNRKKEQVLRETGRLACEVCHFDFASTYGELGAGVADCHHLVPLADLPEAIETHLSDLAIVCPNCHRMLHRGSPPPTILELRALLQTNDRCGFQRSLIAND